MKTPFPNRWSGIFLVESIEGWSKKQDKTSKQTSDHKTNQSGRSKRSLHESQREPRGERDVIRLRNPTEDQRAFRRMLTIADLYLLPLEFGGWLRPRAVSRLRARFARDKIIKSLRSKLINIPSLSFFKELLDNNYSVKHLMSKRKVGNCEALKGLLYVFLQWTWIIAKCTGYESNVSS